MLQSQNPLRVSHLSWLFKPPGSLLVGKGNDTRFSLSGAWLFSHSCRMNVLTHVLNFYSSITGREPGAEEGCRAGR